MSGDQNVRVEVAKEPVRSPLAQARDQLKQAQARVLALEAGLTVPAGACLEITMTPDGQFAMHELYDGQSRGRYAYQTLDEMLARALPKALQSLMELHLLGRHPPPSDLQVHESCTAR